METFIDGEELLLSVLWSIGYAVKHKTAIPNQYIPFILFAVASVLKYLEESLAGLIFGEAPTLSTAVWAVVYGIQFTFFACGGYEAVRAVKFSWQNRRNKKENKMNLKNKDSFLFLAAFLIASSMFTIVALAFGCGWFGTFAKITDGWIFGIWLILSVDCLRKGIREPNKITPTYITMLCLLAVNVVSFTFASITLNRLFSTIGLAVSAVSAITAGVLPYIVSAIKAKRGGGAPGDKVIDEKALQAKWIKNRKRVLHLPEDKQVVALEECLAFKLLGDNIYGGLDFGRPLLTATIDGNRLALTIAAAEKAKEEAGIGDVAIENARAYIQTLV